MGSRQLYLMLAVAVLALCLGPIGISAFVLGFVHGDSPCVLCWAQRTGMILIALTGIFILRFGPRPRYIGLGILISAHGLYMSARHSALHLARDVGQGFSIEILGAHTYVWSGIIFFCSLVLMGVLLLLMRDGDAKADARELGSLDRAAIGAFLVVVAANVVQAFAATGPPPFMGQGDPVRFSFNPKHWVWSLEEWNPAPPSWRGRWGIERPSLDGLETRWQRGPLEGVRPLPVTQRRRLDVDLNGAVTGLGYDATTDRFVLTTARHGVYLLDGDLDRVDRHTVVDPGYSVDVGQLVGATFIDQGSLLALGHNKSFVFLRPSDTVDADANYRYFLESFDRFEEVRRGRFATVRAKMNFVMSAAYGAETDSLYTVSIPNPRYRKLVVSRFDGRDLRLSEEFRPTLSSASGLELRADDRSLDEFYVTGLAVDGTLLYALSAAYNTLLVIDLGERTVVEAYGLEALDRPSGLALRGEALHVAGAGGDTWVARRPSRAAAAAEAGSQGDAPGP
jgi:disulfide bond formation protein DsbB